MPYKYVWFLFPKFCNIWSSLRILFFYSQTLLLLWVTAHDSYDDKRPLLNVYAERKKVRSPDNNGSTTPDDQHTFIEHPSDAKLSFDSTKERYDIFNSLPKSVSPNSRKMLKI